MLFNRSSTIAVLAAGGVSLAGATQAQEANSAWGYSSFGVPGLIDMPTAGSRPDAELNFNAFHFKNQTRIAATFQLTDRLSATFRYAILHNIVPSPGAAIDPDRYDRSFSFQYRFLDEAGLRPSMAFGINDLGGSGIYSGEYIVGSKFINDKLRATVGIGWGRLGSFGSFSNPLGKISDSFKTRPRSTNGLGGTFEANQWFHGPAAFFGGLEYRLNDRWRFIAEYSSDDYTREDGYAFDRKSPFNFAAAYQLNPRTTITGSFLYGSEVGLQVSYALNPKTNRHPSGLEGAPPPVVPRPLGGAGAAKSWEGTPGLLSAQLTPALADQGLLLEGVHLSGKVLAVQIRNTRYGASSEALGRAARVMSVKAPPQVTTFKITLSRNAMPISTTTIPRDDLAKYEFAPVGGEQIRAASTITDAPQRLPSRAGFFPRFNYGIGPYVQPGLFDPDAPLRADLGVMLSASFEPAPGLVFSTRINQRVIGNLNQAHRPSDSKLPHVRSDSDLYYKTGKPMLARLTGAYYFRPGRNLYGRVTAGYLEPMYAGVSGELLWAPQDSKLSFGVEINRVRQRGFDQLFDMRDYEVTTGHLSAYYQLNPDFYFQLDVGRYLAGDTGATLSFARTFDNGWKVGVFATKTNVSAAEFGEGSFDKGISLQIPLGWITGKPDQRNVSTVLRPVQRDGGAMVGVNGRLYGMVRGEQAATLDGNWERFWR
ncbi:YjbH domain-containing protein [Thioclava sp.]|uniref:YjbH domain-containing protein n=1 Tax=Thioclava sp. TaxID=1933450 RepID=UPI003AA85BC0